MQQGPQQAINVGLMHAAPLRVVLEDEKREAQETQAQPLVSGLQGHIRKCWTDARTAKQQLVEPRMIQNMRARRGEYDPDKLAQIREHGGAETFAGMTSVKCRAAGSWLRDILMTTSADRPWVLKPMSVPELSPDINDKIVAAAAQQIAKAMNNGLPLDPADEILLVEALRDQTMEKLKQEARVKADRMADKMESQLIIGGFLDAMDAFIDDITTFPSAILKGPIVRKKKQLKWVPDPKNPGKYTADVGDVLALEWERVSPFDVYPSPAAESIDDGYLIQKHRMSREELTQLIGVDGYDDASIYSVLDDYGRDGLREWLTNDIAIFDAEGKSTTQIATNTDGLIDALEFWGSVQGKRLIEWGMTKEDIPDPTKEYHINAWLIGQYVIKAVLNYDPLHRKPYYKASYEDVPGNFWGNSVCDLVRDPQLVVNAAVRAIVNNMGIASGPQVTVNLDRIAPGEDITQLTPWRIWQTTNDPAAPGQGSKPIEFFQPDSRIQELMAVFQQFSQMADEYSGLPKYLAGDSAGGAGRTASGLSMLMGNAGKSIKQVVANIDIGIMTPLLERLYDHNMMYSDDPDLKGDIHIQAKGAEALVTKDAAQLRRTEFLQATANPIDMGIVGVTGRAAVLREIAKGLDMDPDDVVPAVEVLKAKQLAAQQPPPPPPGAPPQPGGPSGMPPTPAKPSHPAPIKMGSGQTLANGQPTTDNFAPPAQP